MASFLVFWVCLLVHEAAHYATASFLYSPSNWSAAKEPTALVQALVASSGPLSTLLIAIGCAIVTSRSTSPTMARLSTIAVYFAASRLVLTAIPTMLGKANDEGDIALATHVPAPALWIFEVAVAAFTLVWIARYTRGIARHTRWTVTGIVLGWISAFTIGRALGLPI